MTPEEQARKADAEDKPLQATMAYERVLNEGGGDLQFCLDAALVYLQCCDGGYIAAHRLPSDLVQRAYERALQILDQAERRFGAYNELDFWRYYLDFLVLGRDADPRKCEAIAVRGPSLVPYFHLYALSGGERFESQARQLLEEMKEGRTARQRHIRSVLKSRALHKDLTSGQDKS